MIFVRGVGFVLALCAHTSGQSQTTADMRAIDGGESLSACLSVLLITDQRHRPGARASPSSDALRYAGRLVRLLQSCCLPTRAAMRVWPLPTS